MGYIYILVTVAIFMSTKYGRKKTIYIVYYSMLYMCDVDIT